MSFDVVDNLRLPLATLPKRTAPLTYLVVHCSGNGAESTLRAADVDSGHRMRGFHCIGYHYVICRDGVIEKGRPDDRIGAHVNGHNAVSLGICLIGGVRRVGKDLVPEDNFTDAQMESLKALVKQLKQTYPNAIVQGHCDFPKVNKACPSFDVKAWWSEVNAA